MRGLQSTMVLFISGRTRWKYLDFPGDFFRIKQSHLIIKHDYGSSTDKKNHSWRQPSKNPRFCYLNPALPISPAFHTASKATPCLAFSWLFFCCFLFSSKRGVSGGFKSLRICEGEFVSSPRGVKFCFETSPFAEGDVCQTSPFIFVCWKTARMPRQSVCGNLPRGAMQEKSFSIFRFATPWFA